MWIKRNHKTFQTILFITYFCQRLQQHKTLSECDTLHIQYCYHCSRQSRTKVTVAQILSRGPRITTTHEKLNKNLSHGYTDTNIGTNTIQERKHSLRVSWTVAVLGRTAASPRHRPQTWTLDFSVVLSIFSPSRGRRPSVAYMCGDYLWAMNTQRPKEEGQLRWGAWSSGRQNGPCRQAPLQSWKRVTTVCSNGWIDSLRKSAILCL